MPVGHRGKPGLKHGFIKALKKIGIFKSRDKDPNVIKTAKLIFDANKFGIEDLSRELAEEFADDLKRIIETQAFAWAPLSTGYAKRKNMLGLDPRILIATGRYVNSIQAIQQRDGSWIVSVPDEPLQPGSKYTLKDLARWLELGTRHMPPRAHWRPALQLWKTKAYQAKMSLKDSLIAYLRSKGFK